MLGVRVLPPRRRRVVLGGLACMGLVVLWFCAAPDGSFGGRPLPNYRSHRSAGLAGGGPAPPAPDGGQAPPPPQPGEAGGGRQAPPQPGEAGGGRQAPAPPQPGERGGARQAPAPQLGEPGGGRQAPAPQLDTGGAGDGSIHVDVRPAVKADNNAVGPLDGEEHAGVAIAKIKLEKRLPPAVVPDLIHFVRFTNETRDLDVGELVCLLAAHHHGRPGQLLLHTDDLGRPEGPLWDRVRGVVHVALRQRPPGDLTLAEAVTRLQVLGEVGGTALDRYMYTVSDLAVLRRYEMTVAWPYQGVLSTKAVLAAPNATFLSMFRGALGGAQGRADRLTGALTALQEYLASTHPSPVHREVFKLGVDPALFSDLHLKPASVTAEQWRNYHVVDLGGERWPALVAKGKLPQYTVDSVRSLNTAFGDMAREVLAETLR